MNSVKKQIITIAGRPGSGKSTTAKGVASGLRYNHFSSGDLFRQLSKEQGIDVLQLNLAAEAEKGIPRADALVDQKLRDIGEQEDQIVIDSRTAWHWIPQSFKVFLDLDLHTAAQRILGSMTPERISAEHIPDDPNAYAATLQQRLDSESRRYKKLYGVDPYEMSQYDLIVDTATHNLEEVIELVLKEYQAWLNS